MRTHGTLVKWNEERGFGFVAVAAGSEEVFVHVSAFPRDGQRPQMGEMVSFEIQTGADGKRKALRVQRPGQRPAAAARERPQPRDRDRERQPKSRASGLLNGTATVAILVAVAGWAYSRWAPSATVTAETLAPAPLAQPIETGGAFACDGRTQCSQMRSCDEANYFLRHCPGVQLDGNNDGEPCEQQWCN